MKMGFSPQTLEQSTSLQTHRQVELLSLILRLTLLRPLLAVSQRQPSQGWSRWGGPRESSLALP